jgi:hypothetical protein
MHLFLLCCRTILTLVQVMTLDPEATKGGDPRIETREKAADVPKMDPVAEDNTAAEEESVVKEESPEEPREESPEQSDQEEATDKQAPEETYETQTIRELKETAKKWDCCGVMDAMP